MQTAMETAKVSKGALWTGRILSTLIVLFLLLDGAMKLVRPLPTAVVEACTHLGLPPHTIPHIGITVLCCVILYAIPQTAILGAILLTGYLGGAVAINYRVGDPLFGHVLFPVYFGIVIWLALFLREKRLRALVPLRQKA